MPTSLDVTRPVAVARSGWASGCIAALRENSPLLALVAVWLMTANGLSAALGRPQRALDGASASYFGFFVVCLTCLAAGFCIWVLHVTLRRRISIQTGDFWRRIFTEFLARERILLALPVLAVWPVLVLSFSLVKSLIPAIQPFSLDQFFHDADRLLHLGHDPWTLLQPLFGHPLVTYAIDRLYALWLFVMYFSLLLQIASTRDKRLRLHFLLGNVLAWTLLGGVGAILLSSAGPCYFGDVVGSPDPYAPLMVYLRETVQGTQLPVLGTDIELIAIRVQDLLWDYYQQGDAGLGRGISAAPSMHVASTWLIARMLQQYGRVPAILAWGFFGIILLGSIHLGWHYAIDGYLAIAGAWAIWRLVGWWLDRPAVQHFLWPSGLPNKR